MRKSRIVIILVLILTTLAGCNDTIVNEKSVFTILKDENNNRRIELITGNRSEKIVGLDIEITFNAHYDGENVYISSDKGFHKYNKREGIIVINDSSSGGYAIRKLQNVLWYSMDIGIGNDGYKSMICQYNTESFEQSCININNQQINDFQIVDNTIYAVGASIGTQGYGSQEFTLKVYDINTGDELKDIMYNEGQEQSFRISKICNQYLMLYDTMLLDIQTYEFVPFSEKVSSVNEYQVQTVYDEVNELVTVSPFDNGEQEIWRVYGCQDDEISLVHEIDFETRVNLFPNFISKNTTYNSNILLPESTNYGEITNKLYYINLKEGTKEIIELDIKLEEKIEYAFLLE